MMKIQVTFEVVVEAEVPDDWCDRVRQLQRDEGENYIGVDWTDQQILERHAYISGARRWLDEGISEQLQDEAKTWAEWDGEAKDYQVIS